ncbi:MAG: lytic transglycosylase domain-containing protein [Deltaproteobacteria bacterium]|jgi:soluble lytic murein transglycosylase|nr:lytic transglycosylase domain-containing protein [Deltaproteobacteria bacterium]MBW2478890.1 lytic transglycosylase domain-containing protein [Deltaproteobacteria bacterium]
MVRNNLKLLGILSLTLAFPLVAALPVQADIYRYIDENGVMHFTNTPTSSVQNYRIYVKEKPKTTRWYSSEKYDDLISDASERFGVAFPLLKAIIKAESDFDPYAVSKKGATGLMQIMPENFEPLGLQDPFDPWQNINAGARYFKQMYDRFKGKLALSLAAYNAGPTAVDRYKTIPPYEETEEYVRRVLKYYYNYKNL